MRFPSWQHHLNLSLGGDWHRGYRGRCFSGGGNSREMAAKARGLAPEAIRLALYFTAIRKVVEL